MKTEIINSETLIVSMFIALVVGVILGLLLRFLEDRNKFIDETTEK